MKKLFVLTLVLTSLATRLGAQVLIQDSFPYANGVLTNVSSALWTNYSGQSGGASDSFVNNNRLEVFGTRFGDVGRPFTNTPGSVLYAGFIVNSTNLSATSNYFAHFLIAGSTTFKGRIFAFGNAAGTAPNAWRLGISAAVGTGSSIQVFPLDLATNVDYRVVMSYDTVSFLGTLWVDPVVTSDANIQTTDSTTASALNSFGFRQAGPNPALLVDDLYVANSFDEANVGAVKPATVYYQPVPTVTAFTGNTTNLYCVGGGAGTVTFRWQKAGADISDSATIVGSATSRLTIQNATTGESGNYRCIVTSTTNGTYSSSATSTVASVTISVALVPPTIGQQPTNQSVFFGQPATLYVGASGPGTITYQWKTNGIDVTGATGPAYVIPSVEPFNNATNTYRCAVSNEYGGLLSSAATLSATYRPTVPIAYLRTLVDPVTFQSTNSSILYSVIGTVTTYTNLTSANTASYYLQDSTAGINIFVTLGATFRPALGDVVAFYGVLSTFNSTLELESGSPIAGATHFVISNNLASLPAARVIPFDITNSFALVKTNIEGRVAMATNVFFGTNAGTAISTTANQTVIVTNAAGETFGVFFTVQSADTAGQTLPEFAWSVIGPLTQNQANSATPSNANYAITVTRMADIVTSEPPVMTNSVSRSGGNATITWVAVPYSYSYSVLAATSVNGPYTVIASGLTFATAAGTYTDTSAGGVQKYYRVSSP